MVWEGTWISLTSGYLYPDENCNWLPNPNSHFHRDPLCLCASWRCLLLCGPWGRKRPDLRGRGKEPTQEMSSFSDILSTLVPRSWWHRSGVARMIRNRQDFSCPGLLTHQGDVAPKPYGTLMGASSEVREWAGLTSAQMEAPGEWGWKGQTVPIQMSAVKVKSPSRLSCGPYWHIAGFWLGQRRHLQSSFFVKQ